MPRKKIITTESQVRDVAESWARERPDLDPRDYLYLIYVMRLGRMLERLDEQHCRRDYGISGSDMRVLFALRRAGAPFARRPTDLFRALLVTSGAMTKQVDRLAALGYVQRLPDPNDGGSFLIKLTGTGFAIADKAITALTESTVLSKDHSGLSPEERDTLRALCEKVLLDLERNNIRE